MTELWQFSNTQQPVRFNPWYKVKKNVFPHIYSLYKYDTNILSSVLQRMSEPKHTKTHED